MKSNEALIRDATRTDLPGIFAILNREITEGVNTFKIKERTPDQQLLWWHEHENHGYPVLVLEAAGKIAGWASLSAWSTVVEGYHPTAEVSVWVDANHRGRGFGRSLLTEIIDCGREMDLRVLVSKIEASNQISLALHEACGFTEVGVMHGVGQKFDRELDVAILELDLRSM